MIKTLKKMKNLIFLQVKTPAKACQSLFFVLFCLFSAPLLAQEKAFERVRNYGEALANGKYFVTNSQYDSAINYYNAALAFKPENKEIIDKLIKEAFDQIQKTVQQEQAQKTELVSKQQLLQRETQKAQEAEKAAKENEKIAKESQKKAVVAQELAKKSEKEVVIEKGNAIRTLYYFNALDFAKYTGMVGETDLKKQMAMTALLLLDSTDYKRQDNLPLEVLRATIEAQGGLTIGKNGENTHMTWANDSTFYFINHRNQSQLYEVVLQKRENIQSRIWLDSAFSRTRLAKNYVRNINFVPPSSLFLEDDEKKYYVWEKSILSEKKDFSLPKTQVLGEFRTNLAGKIFRNEKMLSFSHEGFISQVALSKTYFLSAGFDGKIIMHRLADSKEIVLYENYKPIYSMSLSPNENFLVFGDEQKVKILFLDQKYLAQELSKEKNLSSDHWQTYKNDNNLLKQPTWKK